MSEKLRTCLSGSIKKFKPEIDAIHDEFTDLGVNVLEPPKGWLILPKFEIQNGYRPLPGEEYLGGIKAIEDRFLAAIKKSNFLYICSIEGYIGNSAGLEIGSAFSQGKPLFSIEPIHVPPSDLSSTLDYVVSTITVASPSEAVAHMQAGDGNDTNGNNAFGGL